MTPTNAKTAALEALIEAHAVELKLPTVRRRFRALAEEAIREQQTPVAYLAALLEAEMAERAERRERRRLIDARFPVIKRLEDFQFADNPNVSPAVIVVLDELGYLALPEGAAELVFQVISERHERGSLIVTSNLPFGEWGKVFPDPRLAKAVVDRLTHRAHIIETGTESWRFRHGLARSKRRGSRTN